MNTMDLCIKFIYIYIFTYINVLSQYICNNNSPSIKFKLPDTLDCSNAKFIDANISLKIRNEHVYTSDAVLFTSVIFKCDTWAKINFFRAEHTYKDIEYYNPDINQILKANETLTFDNVNLIYNNNTNEYLHGIQDYICDEGIFSGITTRSKYIKLLRTQISYRNGVMLSQSANTINCVYKSKFCRVSPIEFIVWDINSNSTNEFIYAGTYKASIIDNNNNYHITFNYLYNNITLVIKKDEYEKHNNKYLVTNNHAFKIRINSISKVNNRDKREVDNIPVKLQYLQNAINSYSSYVLDLCYNVANSVLKIYNLCKSNAYSCISSVLNDTDIKVESVGEIYLVSKCIKVEIIKYKPSYNQNDNKCYFLIPIDYKLPNSSYVYNGYYHINTQRIYSNSRVAVNGMCKEHKIHIKCPQSINSEYCIYETLTGNIKQSNNKIYTLSKETFDSLFILDVDENFIPNIDGPSISSYLSRSIPLLDIIKDEELSNSEKINQESYNKSIIIMSIIIFIIILISIIIIYKHAHNKIKYTHISSKMLKNDIKKILSENHV